MTSVDRKRESKLWDDEVVKGEEGGDKDDDDDDIAEDEIDEGGEKDKGEEVNELWDVVCVIPTDKEKVECRMKGCKCRAVTIWGSNINPEDKWPMCEECQLKEYGGWPEGVDPIKHSTTLLLQYWR